MMNHYQGYSWYSSQWKIADNQPLARTETQTKICKATLVVLSTIVTLLVTDLKPVQAQSAFGNFGIPTPSQRFLEAGRAQLEREIRILQTLPAAPPLLTIDRDVYIQDDLLQLEDPQFHSGNLPSGEIDLPVVPLASPMTDSRSHL